VLLDGAAEIQMVSVAGLCGHGGFFKQAHFAVLGGWRPEAPSAAG